jgi:hypothetical protein
MAAGAAAARSTAVAAGEEVVEVRSTPAAVTRVAAARVVRSLRGPAVVKAMPVEEAVGAGRTAR